MQNQTETSAREETLFLKEIVLNLFRRTNIREEIILNIRANKTDRLTGTYFCLWM